MAAAPTTRPRTRHRLLLGTCLGASLMLAPTAALGQSPGPAAAPDPIFRHVGTFFVPDDLPDGTERSTPTSAEIVAATPDGDTLLFSDPFTARIGLVDISDPSAPAALGGIDLPGNPTSVAVHRGWALAAVETNEDPDADGPLNGFDDPSGDLVVIDLADRSIVRTIELPGQPDSVAVAPSGRYAAIVIENERDEDENDGLLPQAPSGSLQVLDLDGDPDAWTLRAVDLDGIAEVAPEDAEPEFVSINSLDQAVVSLQENNHLVIVDLATGTVINDFSAGTVDLTDIDTVEEELGPQDAPLLELDSSLTGVRREPDAVAWVDDGTFATANEGDYVDADGVSGGSRSFTIFGADGTVVFEPGSSLEHEVVRIGQFPEARADAKGIEPEGILVGTIGDRRLLFVAAERANIVAVLDVTEGEPSLVQLLPSGIGPEGLVLTSQGVLAVTSEVDGADEGFPYRPIITLFAADPDGTWTYPQLRSADEANGLPIPWVGMSGLSSDPSDPDTLWAVSDSVLAQAWLYGIDASSTPAVITERIAIGGVGVADQGTGDFDLEGVAARPEGGFWLASEGRVGDAGTRPNLIIRTDAQGTIQEAVGLPDELLAGATSSGFEGVAVTGTEAAGDEAVWVPIQREWADDEPGHVKIGRYAVADASWTFASYPLETPPAVDGAWVGLSEITALPDGRLAIVERDNQMGQDAAIKHIAVIDPASVTFAPLGEPLPLLAKALLRDVLPDLDAASISVPDKLEGVAVTPDGRLFVVTDNDGVDENLGETVFLGLGPVDAAPAQ